MRSISVGLGLGVLGCLVFRAAEVRSQQVTIATPHHSVSEGFFENMGTSWGMRGNNWFFSFGGSPTQSAPQFGGFDPSAGANFGVGFRHGGVNGFFNANWSQGWRQSFSTWTPSITLPNGGWGVVSDTSQSPFVIGHVPVVGGFPAVRQFSPFPPSSRYMAPGAGASGVGRDAVVAALQRARAERDGRRQIEDAAANHRELQPRPRPAAPLRGQDDDLVLTGSGLPPAGPGDPALDEASRRLAAARASTAGRPVPCVAEARRLHAAEQTDEGGEALVYLERGRTAEARGKPNVAKIYYRMAARRASGQLRGQILSRIQALDSAPESR